MDGAPTSRSTRSAPTERGMTYRARAPWSRSLRSSRRPGEPATWRRETGWATSERRRVRDARGPEPSGCRLAGELIDTETVTISSEGGGWKRTQPVARHCRRIRAHEPRCKPYLASRLPYDMTTTVTTEEGQVCVFIAVDHCTA